MDLHALAVFARVAELASFTRAAEQLGLPKARTSTAVRQLEQQLGTQLLQRTTRSVRLTPDGEQFYARCKELLTEADELASLFRQSPAELRGRLRLDMPTALARNLVLPRLPEFLAAHPLVALEISSTDRQVDLVHEGFDCVVRVGRLRDSELIARPLGHYRMVNCASPDYLARFGTPRSLEDLDRHWLIHYAPTLGGQVAGFEYLDGAHERHRPMAGPVTVNNADAYQAACLAGLGLIQVPAAGVRALLVEGRLVEVLGAHVPAPMPVSLLYAHRHHVPARLQALLAWLAALITPYLQA
ncbi:MAG: LysR family transcriptional regulator [Piscinibacter sp.]|nr:LysR family transcriptional regulator [Piscinibacter sp.]